MYSELLPSLTKLVPGLVGEIVDSVRAAIPDYDRPQGSPYNEVIRSGVERNVLGFVAGLADPAQPHDRRNELCRKLGAFEAMEGRPLAVLQSAYRIGAQLAWSRIRDVLSGQELSAAAVSALAASLFRYMDDAAELSREGYDQVKGAEHEKREAARRLLLRDLVRGPDTDCAAVATLHPAADWAAPDQVTLVALPTGAPVVRPLLDPDLLLDLHDPEPYLLVPGPLTEPRRTMLESALADSRAAVGLTVPLARAADSLRWARQVLALVADGVLDDGTLTLCEDHLVSTWLLADGPLMDQIAQRRLAFLTGVEERRRPWLTDTLRAWLRTRGPAARMSDDLGLHVQTVRYRMRVLEGILREDLTEPDNRFATETALRALWLRGRAGGPGGPSPAGP
ncbi:PucR-like helix-turn-helix protein [Actinocorallia herbida]|uniref:PucR-like helix-turn-helix protein n=1 Tax=Actinocorallia herbida TaxID=58109 RepID=A0A3N1CX70_9ACTN|nr:helix-turn-helix domain-containing protein [Actinocorallia herbida]ROO85899.1 PucR-like helix-turn-helix protein [Actinocorallia herbida]